MKSSSSEASQNVGSQKWNASAENILIFLSLCSIGLLSIVLWSRINGFSDFVHHLDSKELEGKNTICFRPQVRGDTYSVGSLRKS
jgi:hypothetical protein